MITELQPQRYKLIRVRRTKIGLKIEKQYATGRQLNTYVNDGAELIEELAYLVRIAEKRKARLMVECYFDEGPVDL